jgi:CubicO group peptidase (beta-lactamase class C family)
MLEIEKIEKKSLYACVDQFWHHELCHWKKLPEDARCHTTGFREGSDINGEVHDPNAYCLGVELSHAGLFATPKGLAQTLLNLNNKLGLLSEMHQLLTTHRKKFDRFVWGWDTPQGPDSTAGANAPNTVFGHLGFVGNSLWIDAAKQRGLILFTNQSRYAWYERTVLNQLRKQLYSSFWELS